MPRIMPSQVVRTIDSLFPHAMKDMAGAQLDAQHSSKLLGILNLLKDVPGELITLASGDYSDLVLAMSTIEEHLAVWRSRGNVGSMDHVKGFDAVTVIRRCLAKCPDEYPPSASSELSFIKDPELREDIRRDFGAVERALVNAEWKAATVLAGAAIEALLLWRLQEPSPGPAAIQAAVTALVESGSIKKPGADLNSWGLHQYIEVASYLGLLMPDTCSAARLAQNFRNLLHPGRANRLAQTCDRATAYSAVGALEHVIRDLA